MLRVLADSALRSLALALIVWVGIRILNPRSTRLRATAWTCVLMAASAMPFLMRWQTFQVPALPRMASHASMSYGRADTSGVAAIARSIPHLRDAAFPWLRIAFSIYLAVSLLLILRFVIGLLLAQRTWLRATPIHAEWATGFSVRETPEVRAPAASACGVLFPLDWREWDSSKLHAVLAHERSHIAHGDFYVRLLAVLHSAVFWFSPLAWWLSRELAELHEAASDDAALATFADRSSYAEILLFFARTPQRASFTLAMARVATVSRRVDRILAASFAPARASARQYVGVGACLVGLTALIAGGSVRGQTSEPPKERADFKPTHSQSENRGEPYVMVSGDSETMSGSSEDAESARSLRSQFHGDYLWFLRRGKSYVITDAATVARAKELFRPQEELGRQQEELGAQQEKLGKQQAELGEQEARVSVKMPAMDADLDSIRQDIKQELKHMSADANLGTTGIADAEEKLRVLDQQLRDAKGKEVTQEKLSELQARVSEIQARSADSHADVESKLGDLQSRFGELQTRAGEAQSRLGDEQSKLGDEQSRLGDQQSKLGEEQSRLADKASRQVRILIDEAMRNGRAIPVQ